MSPLLTCKVGDFLKILRSRGLHEKADLYETTLNIECFIQGVDVPLNLTVEEMIELIERPDESPILPVPAGWDNFYHGRAAR